MRHCVHSYWPRVLERESFIFSIRKGAESLATLEVCDTKDVRWLKVELSQIRAARNKKPPKEVREAALSFISMINTSVPVV
jgi:PcfJ-like protein